MKKKKKIFFISVPNFSVQITFHELISIASLSALILFFLDFELYLKNKVSEASKLF